ncbi:unnamed protein product [Closterium sp. Yama58-4]|nr:unnamed protein product [Closterium sp. Yama58-4]
MLPPTAAPVAARTAASTTCTGAAEVASLPPPTKDHVDATWLSAALGLPATAVASVAVRPFAGGFSPIVKARLDVTYTDASRVPHGADPGANSGDSSNPARSLFMKLLPPPPDTSAGATAQQHQLGDAILAMVKQAHRVEAAFYTLAMAPRSRHVAAVVPRAYHANPDQAILLEDVSCCPTLTPTATVNEPEAAAETGHEGVHGAGYEVLSAWSMELTEGPDVARAALLATVHALAVLHTADFSLSAAAAAGGSAGDSGSASTDGPGGGEVSGTVNQQLLTWNELIDSRAARVMIPVEHSADKLAALMLQFVTRFCPQDAEPGTPLHALCAASARVGYAGLMRAITLPPAVPAVLPHAAHSSDRSDISKVSRTGSGSSTGSGSGSGSGTGISSLRGILHGDPNPGNVLYHKGRNEALLIDFQDTAAGAPGVVDLARLLLSSLQPGSRVRLEEERDLLLAMLGDAMMIMASVGFTLEARGPALLYALGERSIMCVRDHCKEMLAAVQEVEVSVGGGSGN